MSLVSYFVSYNFAKVMKIIKNKEKREEKVEKDDKKDSVRSYPYLLFPDNLYQVEIHVTSF